MNTTVSFLEAYNNFFNDYETDHDLAKKFVANVAELLALHRKLQSMVLLITDVQQADRDIKEGNTVSVDQAFDV